MQPRSILFLNRVYPPAEGATGQLLADVAVGLAKAGWRVTVLTCQTRQVAARSEIMDNVRIERVGAISFSRSSHWRRALSYLTLYPALLWRALRLPRADVVVTMTDPPLLVMLSPILKWLKGSRLVHWAQDLYPELAEELGVLSRGGFLASLCRGLSTWALCRQHDILAIGRCMKQRLLERGLPETSVRVVPNWAPGSTVYPIDPSVNPFRQEHGLADRFVVMYSGNLGLAHPFEAILDAARRIQPLRLEILFLFVGAGARLEWVRQQASARKLENVRFLPPQPLEQLARSLSAADVHLASMREELCGLVVPSKVYGILAAGRPCIFLGPAGSEVAQLIDQQGLGRVLSSNDGAALADCLISWTESPRQTLAAGRRAAEASRAFDAGVAVRALQDTMMETCWRTSGRPGRPSSEDQRAPTQPAELPGPAS